MHVKKGDQVIVIAGNDKGRTGEIKQVLSDANRVVVEGVNMRWKHRRPTQKNPKGERVQEACAIHASNVMFLDPETGKGTRHRNGKLEAKPQAEKRPKPERKPKAKAETEPAETEVKAAKPKSKKKSKASKPKASKPKAARKPKAAKKAGKKPKAGKKS